MVPLTPPIEPQLARSAGALPEGAHWWFEPKWDGFRAIVFADGTAPFIQSRNGRPLARYFPELTIPDGRFVADGEIIVPGRDGSPDFEALQQRIHPAASRIGELARATPARFVAFDVLAVGDEVLLEVPFLERRRRLEGIVGLETTPGTTVAAESERWLHSMEGVVAKDLRAPYRPGERQGMVKVKRVRTLDCVLMAWRPGREEGTVGSLLLGLHGDGGLRPVGHTSGFTARQKRDLVGALAPYETGRRGAGEPSRWSGGREHTEWVELRPELVVEVQATQVSGGRIRHGARLVAFRPDLDPAGCGVDQLHR